MLLWFAVLTLKFLVVVAAEEWNWPGRQIPPPTNAQSQQLVTQRCYTCRNEDFACPLLGDATLTDCKESEYCIKFAPYSNFTYFNMQKNQYISIVGERRACVDQTLELQLNLMGVKELTTQCYRHQNITTRGINGRNLAFSGDYCLCDLDACNGSGVLHQSPVLVFFTIILISAIRVLSKLQ